MPPMDTAVPVSLEGTRAQVQAAKACARSGKLYTTACVRASCRVGQRPPGLCG